MAGTEVNEIVQDPLAGIRATVVEQTNQSSLDMNGHLCEHVLKGGYGMRADWRQFMAALAIVLGSTACGGGSGDKTPADTATSEDSADDSRQEDGVTDGATPTDSTKDNYRPDDGMLDLDVGSDQWDALPDVPEGDLDVQEETGSPDVDANETGQPDVVEMVEETLDVTDVEVVEGDVITVTGEQPDVPLPDPETYQFVDRVSFVSRILVPKASEMEPCCFDFTGDGVIDNQANEFLDLLGATLDPTWIKLTDSLQASIDEDRTSYVLEFKTLSQEGTAAQFNIWPAEGDLNWDGVPDQTPAQRYAGEGIFGINPMGFTSYSPVSQFTQASFANGKLKALGGRITARLAMQGGDYLPLVVRKFSLIGPLVVSADSVATEDVDQGNPNVVPSLRGGGVIDIKQVIEYFNDVAPTCLCAEVDPGSPLFTWEIKGGKLKVECTQDIVQLAAQRCSVAQHGFVCGSIGNICVGVGLIGAVADASTGDLGSDGAAGKDAISFGGYFSLSPATLATPTVAPNFLAVDDQITTPPFFGNLKLDVLGNDIDALAGDPTITAVTQPTNGTVEILQGGKALAYSTDNPKFGMRQFTYTIQSAGQSDTATVYLDVPLPEGLVCAAEDDERTILLKRGPQRVDGLLDNDFILPGYEAMVEIATGLGWQQAYVGVTADRKGLMVHPLDTWQDGNTTTISYGINQGEGPYVIQGSADIFVTYKNPEVKCGDGWLDGWAGEECDPGVNKVDPYCDSQCHLAVCAGGSAPFRVFADVDDDDFGNPHDFMWTCEWLDGYVADNTDCDDTSNQAHPGNIEICGDSLNNGCKLTYDCGNEDCALGATCREVECDDDQDNDGNGKTDCQDPACVGVEVCTDWDCGDGIDNEGDGLTDCDDLGDCAWKAPCSEGVCDDQVDGDNDGLTDCKDPDCKNHWLCREQNCNDNVDNDEDGLTDCDDLEDCGWSWDCSEGNCTDGNDNDDDGVTDCDDPDCSWHPNCG